MSYKTLSLIIDLELFRSRTYAFPLSYLPAFGLDSSQFYFSLSPVGLHSHFSHRLHLFPSSVRRSFELSLPDFVAKARAV